MQIAESAPQSNGNTLVPYMAILFMKGMSFTGSFGALAAGSDYC